MTNPRISRQLPEDGALRNRIDTLLHLRATVEQALKDTSQRSNNPDWPRICQELTLLTTDLRWGTTVNREGEEVFRD